MATYKFDTFVFNSDDYQLKRHGKRIDLRPKALRLLRLLIENRERVVSKSEIFAYVWGEGYARDHLLFQLVSELRKAPFEANYVRTQPNQGYQWNVATRVVQSNRPFAVSKIAASFFVGLVFAFALYFGVLDKPSPMKVAQLASSTAFSKGVLAMEAGEGSQAIDWFEFSLQENPDSIESSLFLAEALLHEKRYQESSEQLYSLLSKENLSSYHKASATDLLSQVYQRQGMLNTALKYAMQTRDGSVIAQCSSDIIDERVDVLREQLGVVALDDSSIPLSDALTDLKDTALAKNYKDKCSELRQELEETSLCVPNQRTSPYVYLISNRHIAHS